MPEEESSREVFDPDGFIESLAKPSPGHYRADGTLDVEREISNKVTAMGLRKSQLGGKEMKRAVLKLHHTYSEYGEHTKRELGKIESLKEYANLINENGRTRGAKS